MFHPTNEQTYLSLQRIPSVDLKQTYAIVLRIHHVNGTACVNPHAGWLAKVRAFDCAWIKCVERLPFVTEDLNLVENRITDVNIASVVYSQSGAMICIGQVNGAQEMAPCIDNLNARVACIEHEQFGTGRDHLAGESELAGTITTAAVPELANQSPSLVHNKDHVPLPIAHVNASRSSIDRDPCWAIEVRFSSSQFPRSEEH